MNTPALAASRPRGAISRRAPLLSVTLLLALGAAMSCRGTIPTGGTAAPRAAPPPTRSAPAGGAPPPDRAADLDHACSGGDAKACFELSEMVWWGKGAPEDPARAFTLLDAACDGQVIEACYRLGDVYRQGIEVQGDLPRAVHLYERACLLGQGRAAACVTFAEMLNTGLGVKRDHVKALRILGEACDSGEREACSYLGLLYTEGLVPPLGVARPEVGMPFSQRACDLGQMGACLGLGRLYIWGSLVPRDVPKARSFFEKACRGGDADGCKELERTAPQP